MGVAELTRTLLPVSEVPLDISARTHNEPVLLKEAPSHLAPSQTERRAKMWLSLMPTWRTVLTDEIAVRCTHYLTKQAELWSCAIAIGWSF